MDVYFSTIKMFSYEPDFNLLIHILFDNISERSTLVKETFALPPYWDKTIFLNANIYCSKALLKFFTGSRANLAEYMEDVLNTEYVCKEDFIFKNPASLAAVDVSDLMVRLSLKNAGGILFLVDVKKFSVYDFRNNSKLGEKVKEVISSLVVENEKSKFEEGESTISKIEHFVAAPSEGFDVSLDSVDAGALNKEFLQTSETKKTFVEPAHRRYLERLREKLTRSNDEENSDKKYVYADRVLAAKHKIKKVVPHRHKKNGVEVDSVGRINKEHKKNFFDKVAMRWKAFRTPKVRDVEQTQTVVSITEPQNLQSIGNPQNNLVPQIFQNLGSIPPNPHNAQNTQNPVNTLNPQVVNVQAREDPYKIEWNPEGEGQNPFYNINNLSELDIFDDLPQPIDLKRKTSANSAEITTTKPQSSKWPSTTYIDSKTELLDHDEAAKSHRQSALKEVELQHHLGLEEIKPHRYSKPEEIKLHRHSGLEEDTLRFRQNIVNPPGEGSVDPEHAQNPIQNKALRPKFIIHEYEQCSRFTIPGNRAEDMSNDSQNDLYVYVESDYRGEMYVYTRLQNKTILFVADLFQELMAYFLKPFNGSEVVPYWKEIAFNNLPPMKVKSVVNNCSIALLEDYTHLVQPRNDGIRRMSTGVPNTYRDDQRKDCLIILVNTTANLEWIGDILQGPGSNSINVDTIVRNVQITKADTIFEPRTQKLKLEDLSHASSQSTADAMDPTQVPLVEPFKIHFSTHYQLDVYRKGVDRTFPAIFKLQLFLINNRDLKNNFLFSMDHLRSLLLIGGNLMRPSINGKRFMPAHEHQLPPVIKDIVVSHYEVRMQSLKVVVFKLRQGIDLAKLRVSHLILKMRQDSQSDAIMKMRATISVDCFNRRKVRQEPLIEPWQLWVKYEMKQGSTSVELRNLVRKDMQFNSRINSHIHDNSLNVNLSTAGIETLLEIMKLFTKEMVESDPYCIKNYLGLPIRISNANGGTQSHLIHNSCTYNLTWKFFNLRNQKIKHFLESHTKSYINVQIPDPLSADQDFEADMEFARVKSDLDIGLRARDSTRKSSEIREEGEKSIVKQLLCDQLGKTVYSMKNRTIALQQTKKGNNIFAPRFTNDKVINDPHSSQVVSSVTLNIRTGMKEVTLRSLIVFKNNLETSLLLKLKSRSSIADEVAYEVKAGEKFYFPIYLDVHSMMLSISKVNYEATTPKSLSEYIKENSTKAEFSEEELLSADSETEIGTYKDGYLRNKREEKIRLTSMMVEYTPYSFCLGCHKRKVKSNIKKGAAGQEQDQKDFCWESYLVANPFIYVSNAVPKPVTIKIGDRRLGRVEPGQVKVQYNIDQVSEESEFSFIVDSFRESFGKKIFRRIDKREKMVVKIKAMLKENEDEEKGAQWIYLDVIRVSTYSRHVIIYCPYLIINETGFRMYYQEAGLTTRTLSVDPYKKEKDVRPKKGAQYITGYLDKSRVGEAEVKYDNEEFDGRSSINTAINPGTSIFVQRTNSATKDARQELEIECHMFSPTKKISKVQVSLNRFIWSKPLSLQSSSGMVTLIESKEEMKRKQQERAGVRYLGAFAKMGGKLLKQIKAIKKIIEKRSLQQTRREGERKKFEFSVRTQNGLGIFSRSKLLIISPRFAIKNETEMFLVVKQDIALDIFENKVKLKPHSWSHFHWSNHNLTEAVNMSISDANFLRSYGWSGRFRIDEVGVILVLVLNFL